MPSARDRGVPRSGRSVSPSSPTSPSSSRGDQADSQSPDAIKADTSESVDPDQKNKKRIQNRVAQRTYRKNITFFSSYCTRTKLVAGNRMKQRVQDLERQLCEMRTRQQQQQYFPHDLPTSDGSIAFNPSTGCLPPQLWQQQPTSYPMSPEIWPPMPSPASHYQVHDGTGMTASAFMSRSFPPQPSYNESTLMNQMHLTPASHSPNVMLQSDIELQHSSPIMGLYGDERGARLTASEQVPFDTRLQFERAPVDSGKP